jgi:hypothetical protein
VEVTASERPDRPARRGAVIVCDKEGKYKVTTNELQDALHGEAVPA